MGYIGATPSNAFINNDVQRVTNSTNNYVALDHNISSLDSVIVFVNNVRQESTNLSFTSANRITLGDTLTTSDVVEIVFIGKAVATQSAAANSITNSMLAGSIANSKLATDPLNASNLASGTVPTVRLGSGTASSSNFLRGDGSWQSAGGENSPNFLANASTTSTSTGTHTSIINPTELYDTDNLYDTSTGRFTVTSSTAGYYYIYAGIGYAQITATRIQAGIWKNGYATSTGFRVETHASSGYPALHVSGVFNLSNNEYVQLIGYQASGGSISCTGEPNKNYFGGFKLIT